MEKPYYGYGINKHVIGALIGGGITGIVLAISFTVLGYSTRVLVSCSVFGSIMLIFGVFWYLVTGFINDPIKTKHFYDNFTHQLQTLWHGKGDVLDIGTGLGRAAIEVAKRFPESRVIGLDTWEKSWPFWGMTKEGAERNAGIESVTDRCAFQYGSALKLPFGNGVYQLVVSVFVLHAIKIPDRTVLIKEAIRVLIPGGIFLICDLFPRGYKVRNVRELIRKIEGLGTVDVKFVTFKEAGIELGRFTHIWPMGYLNGRKL